MGMIKDSLDNITKKYIVDNYYDEMQHYIIIFKKEGFDGGITFFKLYWFLIKVK